MHQLSPQESFPIVYLLSDPNDTATYYVRSVVRNSVTGSIIQIAGLNYVNLTDGGSRRFAKKIQAPNDPGGMGTWIDITTTVYTDSGYTTKSDIYAEQLDKYVIQQRWNTALGVGGGGFSSGGADGEKIDYKKIKEIFLEVWNSLPTTDIPNFDLSPVLRQFDVLGSKIDEIDIPDIPPAQNIDLEPAVKKIISKIDDIQPTDLSPIFTRIKNIEFPKIQDYTDALEKITALVKELYTIIPHQKYSKFLDELIQVKESGIEKDLRTTRLNRLQGLDNNDRIRKLIS